jgi:hypothetical protein
MIGKALHLVSAVMLVAGTAVVAQPSDGGSSQSNANKQICRTTPDTGSRLGRTRSCHTAQEWIELRRQTKQNVDRIQSMRPDTCPPYC